MSGEVKWIKIVADVFDDEKILLIESLPEADSIIVCWFKILCLAGKLNNSGVLFFTDKIPYTEEMLATVFRRPLQIVRLALATFENFGMIEIVNGVITIPNWEKHQSEDRLEKLREYQKQYQRQYRAKQAMLADGKASNKLDRKLYINGLDKDKDKEKDKEVEKETTTMSDSQKVLDAWNALDLNGIRCIVPGSERETLLKARIKEHGLDTVLEAIDRIRQSDFLHGQNKNNWTIYFDWFIRPRNFLKVLEGNYDNRGDSRGSSSNYASTQSSTAEWNVHYD